jgi:hypothetical protein
MGTSRWCALAGIALLLCACNLAPANHAAPTDAATAESNPAPTPIAQSNTYVHPTIHYAFDYPAGWYLNDDDPNFVQVWSTAPESITLGNESAIQGDYVIMSVLASDDSTTDPISTVAERYKEVLASSGTVIASETPIRLPSGLEAVELRTSDTDLLVLTVINGYMLQIDGVGTPDYFYAVLNTLRGA